MQWDYPGNYDEFGVWDEGYVSEITSEHKSDPTFVSVIQTLTQPLLDMQTVTANMPNLFDIDNAVGEQLDITGKWIGESRYLSVPITNVYFTLDDANLGFDQGTWLGPFDPVNELDTLPDDSFRQLLYAKIANNQWDGTVPGAYEFMKDVFPGNTFFIQDNQDMTMLVGVFGSVPLNAVSYALLTGGYLDLKPAGVRITGYAVPSVPGTPMFCFDTNNYLIAGFDTGCFATISGGQ